MYRQSIESIVKTLASNATSGLKTAQVNELIKTIGFNQIQDNQKRKWFHILYEQIASALVILLIGAAVVSIFLGEVKDAFVIGLIILLNAGLGFFQDFKAEKAIAALKELSEPEVRVLRDGEWTTAPVKNLVPGDIIELASGTIVPADCRLISSSTLKIKEASLTGESAEIDKHTETIDEECSLADQKNMAFSGTEVASGRGLAIVTATGMQTEIGKIANLITRVKKDPTPLQKKLSKLGKELSIIALVVVAVVFTVGIMGGSDIKLMFMTAIGMAVAVVPEGLPAVATVALALGAKRMLREKALIRKLPAVETLGSVTTICSDKTGTLTQNKMSVEKAHLMGEELNFANQHQKGSIAIPALAGILLCNDAKQELHNGKFLTVGEPTEAALLDRAISQGLESDIWNEKIPRTAELPFTSARKRMTTIHNITDSPFMSSWFGENTFHTLNPKNSCTVAFTKGAADVLLEFSTHHIENDQFKILDNSAKATYYERLDQYAQAGYRVMAIGCRFGDFPLGETESDLIFLGLICLRDPPRIEVAGAVATCKSAGIRPVMITGDHPKTAVAIGREIGIGESDRVHTGLELDHELRKQNGSLDRLVKAASFFARVAPEHKLHIVKSLQSQKEVVAMTGDGVNDAPALKQADIGVAMGIMGTDVSKASADIILLDDNFSTIVKAVKEGRIVYDNIRKFVKYTLTSNAGEILVMLLAPLFGLPLPLLPLQILWVNLITDGLPGMALAVEQAESDVMQRPPYSQFEGIFARGLGRDIVWIGSIMGGASLATGWFLASGIGDAYFRTVVFTVLTLSQLGNALATRSERQTLIRIGLLSNKMMFWTVAGSIVLQVAVIYLPVFQNLLGTVSLAPDHLLICFFVSFAVFALIDAAKLLVTPSSDTAASKP